MDKRCIRCDGVLIGSERRGSICNRCLDLGYGSDEETPVRTRATDCTYCGFLFQAEDDPGYEASPGVWLCDPCWDNHDPAHPEPSKSLSAPRAPGDDVS